MTRRPQCRPVTTALGLLLAVAIATVPGACDSSSRTTPTSAPAGSVLTVRVGSPVHARVGQVIHVSFGTINPSVGDSWSVTAEPDRRVVADHGPGERTSCRQGETGCPETA